MRVLTWNLWWRFGPWAERQPAIAASLAAEVPDVVCLQEVWGERQGPDQARVLADALGFDVARSDGPWWEDVAFGNAVLSRWPIVASETVRLPRPDGEPGHRSAIAAVIDHPGGPLVAVSTHLDHRFDASADRARQVGALCRFVEGLRARVEPVWPVVVGGDLNATPDSDEVRLLTGRSVPPVAGLVFTDAWEVAGDGPGWTWRDDNPYLAEAAWPRRRLDYVLVSWPRTKPIGQPRRAWLAGLEPIDGVHPSDHAAVVVDLHDPT